MCFHPTKLVEQIPHKDHLREYDLLTNVLSSKKAGRNAIDEIYQVLLLLPHKFL